MTSASIKDQIMHDELREQGTSMTRRNRSRIGRHGGRTGPYDTWTVLELRERARELGLTGYSSLSKSDLIFELRNH
jgi:hypothetical protein